MELTEQQKVFQEIINKAWSDEAFKKALVKNPIQTLEQHLGRGINFPEGKKLKVVDQTDNTVVYINIPMKSEMDNVELNEEQLEMVSGGRDIEIIQGNGPFNPFPNQQI